MANLYTQISSNVRKTWLLMSVFLILIIGVGYWLSYVYDSPDILIIAVIFSVGVSSMSYWYSDKIVLGLNKAQEIKKSDNPELYRLVENLCITAGLPTPKIYILNEDAPNAFATGRNPQHAMIAVTRGLLEKMNKTELEGVIAHELSHIGNRDMLLQTVVVILVGVLTMACNLFFRLSFYGGGRRSSSNDREGGQATAIFFILGLIAVILAPILAKLLSLAISRKREFLADSSGAMLTRYPEGLASALEKIAADTTPLTVANPAMAHLYISSPFQNQQKISWLAKLFMTHPPIEERIRILKQMNT
ncbi:MAG: M48 family metallopeptidase [Candidatus Parcubacteria bacterium]|nr:M48 family metallopeptidase [Candidatus Parcubacteria bacterium]